MARRFSGQRLRTVRTAADVSRTDLASAIGMTYQMLYLYEQSRSVPSGDVLIRLIDVLGCTLDDLAVEDAAVVTAA